jgi:hypothetical protein
MAYRHETKPLQFFMQRATFRPSSLAWAPEEP